MSALVICQGCGQRVKVPPGHRRRKLQCPCGVIVELTEAALAEAAAAEPAPVPAGKTGPAPARPTAAPSTADEDRWAAELLAEDEPGPAPDIKPLPTPAVEELPPLRSDEPAAPSEAPAKEDLVPCRRCGQLIRRQRECPTCDATEPPPLRLSLDDPFDEELGDGSPYELHGGNDISCPECTKVLPVGTAVCTRCGYDFRGQKKLVRTYQPLARSWETNWSLRGRVAVFLVLQVVAFVLSVIWHWKWGLDPVAFGLSTLLFAGMTSFLLGTFDRIDLARNEKGRVSLTILRRICFIQTPPQKIAVHGYEGVVTGRDAEVSGWEWFVLMVLLIAGVVPGLIWWYFVMHKITFHAALSKDHGYPDTMVYQGWSEEQMREIARTVADAAGMQLGGV